MRDEEAAQEDGRGGADLGGQLAELGGAQALDGVEAQELFLLGGREELGQRGLVDGGRGLGRDICRRARCADL